MNTTTRIPIVLMSVEETAQAVSISVKTVRSLIRQGRQMRQNFGYDGYDPNITMWENWEDAVADEDKTE